uniref:Transmembrane protein n=1 Tax=Mesocestoides corti TaxID=53468 RepID=A0A5K3FCG6_MESCO
MPDARALVIGWRGARPSACVRARTRTTSQAAPFFSSANVRRCRALTTPLNEVFPTQTEPACEGHRRVFGGGAQVSPPALARPPLAPVDFSPPLLTCLQGQTCCLTRHSKAIGASLWAFLIGQIDRPPDWCRLASANSVFQCATAHGAGCTRMRLGHVLIALWSSLHVPQARTHTLPTSGVGVCVRLRGRCIYQNRPRVCAISHSLTWQNAVLLSHAHICLAVHCCCDYLVRACVCVFVCLFVHASRTTQESLCNSLIPSASVCERLPPSFSELQSVFKQLGIHRRVIGEMAFFLVIISCWAFSRPNFDTNQSSGQNR